MILLKYKYARLFASVLTLAIISCSNPWDDRENNGHVNLNFNLTQAITNKAETSEFARLLVETGYDTILAASKTYTVFVPTNAAIDQIGDEILGDPEALKEFVGNHIALTAYSSERNEEETQIKMFSTKYLTFKGSTQIDDATIVTANQYAKNGVFHIIDKALTPKLNIWQYIKSQEGTSATSDYLLSLKDFNIYKSDSIAKVLSEENGAGYLADSLTNSYLKNVYNLNNEKNSYTLFLMEDDGYNEEVDKMKPYLIKPSDDAEIDSTGIYSQYFTLRDMAFHGKYELDELPSTLVSRFGVEVPIDKTQIVGEPIHLSNGIVYIMKRVDVPLAKRLLTTKIEGENNGQYFNFIRSRMFYRDRTDLSGLFFQDIYVQNPGSPQPWITYSAKDFYSTTYKVYWRAINDIQTNVFQQRLMIYGKSEIINDATFFSETIVLFPYMNVELDNYDEVFIGEFTLNEARDIDFISLVGANTSTNGNNSLTLDYLKFIPVLK
ncbi:fasciclin domain-containing protein [Flavobacterium sp. GSA192]|uniref:fasciclin domain-containing protein n=1 Tax=Flavobacterium sp. GSA192 TaxID=2576304 RepID=UPI00112AC2E1|nr:fasciclin domain-containing protein [Flavobacterium sp. GSA192]